MVTAGQHEATLARVKMQASIDEPELDSRKLATAIDHLTTAAEALQTIAADVGWSGLSAENSAESFALLGSTLHKHALNVSTLEVIARDAETLVTQNRATVNAIMSPPGSRFLVDPGPESVMVEHDNELRAARALEQLNASASTLRASAQTVLSVAIDNQIDGTVLPPNTPEPDIDDRFNPGPRPGESWNGGTSPGGGGLQTGGDYGLPPGGGSGTGGAVGYGPGSENGGAGGAGYGTWRGGSTSVDGAAGGYVNSGNGYGPGAAGGSVSFGGSSASGSGAAGGGGGFGAAGMSAGALGAGGLLGGARSGAFGGGSGGFGGAGGIGRAGGPGGLGAGPGGVPAGGSAGIRGGMLGGAPGAGTTGTGTGTGQGGMMAGGGGGGGAGGGSKKGKRNSAGYLAPRIDDDPYRRYVLPDAGKAGSRAALAAAPPPPPREEPDDDHW